MALRIVPQPLTFTDGQPYENSKYFEYGDYHLHYRIDKPNGEIKDKIFMIHGFGCNTAFFDELVEQYLEKGYYIVRVDLPDFGYSTREQKGINYVPETVMLQALLDELSDPDDKWIVLGHSMGGSVSLQLTAENDSRIKGVILNAPLLMANVPPFLAGFYRIPIIGKVMDFALSFLAGHDTIGYLVMYLMTFSVKYTKTVLPERVLGPFRAEKTGTGLAYMTSVTRKPSKEAIGKISVPIQLVWGGIDIFVMPFARKHLEEALPEGADIRMIHLGNHCIINNYAKKLAKWGDEFIEKI